MLIKFQLKCNPNNKYDENESLRFGYADISENGFIEGCILNHEHKPETFICGYIFSSNIFLFELDKNNKHYFKYILNRDNTKLYGKYQIVVDEHKLNKGLAFFEYRTVLKQQEYTMAPVYIKNVKQELPVDLVGTYFEIGCSKELLEEEINVMNDPQIRFSDLKKSK